MPLTILSWNIENITSDRVANFVTEIQAVVARAHLTFILESTQGDLDRVRDRIANVMLSTQHQDPLWAEVFACGGSGAGGGHRAENTIVIFNTRVVQQPLFSSVIVEPDLRHTVVAGGVNHSTVRAVTVVDFGLRNSSQRFRIGAWHAPIDNPSEHWQAFKPALAAFDVDLVVADFNFTSAEPRPDDEDIRTSPRVARWIPVLPDLTTTIHSDGTPTQRKIDFAFLNDSRSGRFRSVSAEVISIGTPNQLISDHYPVGFSMSLRGFGGTVI